MEVEKGSGLQESAASRPAPSNARLHSNSCTDSVRERKRGRREKARTHRDRRAGEMARARAPHQRNARAGRPAEGGNPDCGPSSLPPSPLAPPSDRRSPQSLAKRQTRPTDGSFVSMPQRTSCLWSSPRLSLGKEGRKGAVLDTHGASSHTDGGTTSGLEHIYVSGGGVLIMLFKKSFYIENKLDI